MKSIKLILLLPCLLVAQLVAAGPWSDVLDRPVPNPEKISQMIKDGVDVNKPEKYGFRDELQYPLALVNGDSKESLKVREMLIDAGAKVNQQDGAGRTALHTEANSGNAKAAQLLIDHGADINRKDNDGKSPLLIAASQTYPGLVQVLLKAGADVKTRDKDKKTALHVLTYSASEGDILSIAKSLIEHGADMRAQAGVNETPLHRAVQTRKLGVAKLLVSKGVAVDVKSSSGATPLHSVGTNEEAAAWLLDQGANIEARRDDGATPLLTVTLMASLFDKPDIVKLLVDRGARVDVKDNKGNTPISRSSGKVREILLAALKTQGTDAKPSASAENDKKAENNRLNDVINAYADHIDKSGQAYQQAKQKAAEARGFSGLKTREDVQARQKLFADFKDKSMTLIYLLKESKSLAWKAVQENKVEATQKEVEDAVEKKFGDRIEEKSLKPLQAQFYWADAYNNVFTMLDKNWGDWSVDEHNRTLNASDKAVQNQLNTEMKAIGELETYLNQ